MGNPSRILITGAAGVLGRLVTKLLGTSGRYELRLTDVCAVETPHPFVRADLSRPEETRGLCEDVDQVLHIAGIHPWKQYAPEQYLDCNVKGTHNVVREAAKAGVRRLIYTSSIGAMGYEPGPDCPLPFDETKPCRPVEDVYNVSKLVGEQFCQMYRYTDGLEYLALRLGCFIPCDEESPEFGLGLLSGRLHWEDAAQAHVLALQSDVVNEAIIITATVPFTRQDGPALVGDAPAVILRYFPEARTLEEQGVELPKQITRCYRIGKAQRLLHFQPRVTFETWLDHRLHRPGTDDDEREPSHV